MQRIIGGVLAFLLVPVALGAQTARPVDGADIDLGAFEEYRRLTANAGARIERALLLDKNDEAARRPLLEAAEREARRALQLLPAEADAWFLVAASVGMLSEHESARRQVQMAAEVWAAADSALARDPDHAGAHHIVGRLNYEAMRASGFVRLVATHLFGSTLMRRASWQAAERHMRRAAELEPDLPVHRLWLARLYVEQGDEQTARPLFQSVLSRAPASELERRWQQEARAELADL